MQISVLKRFIFTALYPAAVDDAAMQYEIKTTLKPRLQVGAFYQKDW